MRGLFEIDGSGAHVAPVGGHGSHLVGDLSEANALIVVPEDVTSVDPASRCRCSCWTGTSDGTGPGTRRGLRPTSTSPAPPGWSTSPPRTSPPAPPLATGRVLVSPEVVALLRGEGVPKGDALGVARVAGIMAAKRTPDLVPLCHPLAISGVTVDLDVLDDAVEISATVRTTDRTGVEMEALTAVSVAALTVVDMVKAVDKGAVIADVRVESKTGGKSGDWTRRP